MQGQEGVTARRPVQHGSEAVQHSKCRLTPGLLTVQPGLKPRSTLNVTALTDVRHVQANHSNGGDCSKSHVGVQHGQPCTALRERVAGRETAGDAGEFWVWPKLSPPPLSTWPESGAAASHHTLPRMKHSATTHHTCVWGRAARACSSRRVQCDSAGLTGL